MSFVDLNCTFVKQDFSYKCLSEGEYCDVKRVLEHSEIRQLISEGHITPTSVEVREEKDKGRSHYFLVQEKPMMSSYPFEWSFNMLKDASLIFLKIAERCIESNLFLTTARADSVFYKNGRMQFRGVLEISDVFVDDKWPGYQQFLEAFLFPLLFNSVYGVDHAIWWRGTLRGMSFDEAVKLLGDHKKFIDLAEQLGLPLKSDFNFGISLDNKKNAKNIIQVLNKFIRALEKKYSVQEFHWKSYQKSSSYTDPDIKSKENFVLKGLKKLQPKRVIDLGTNTGHYSKLLQDYVSHVIAIDSESVCIDDLYLSLTKSQSKRITPVLCNMLNPASNLGYDLGEYRNFFERANADFFLALAVMHHITVPTHISLKTFIVSMKRIACGGIIEWISPEEKMTKLELKKPKHRHKQYNWNHFERHIREEFEILDTLDLHSGDRKLCLLGPKDSMKK